MNEIYALTVKSYNDRIDALREELHAYKTNFLDTLYFTHKVSPEIVVNDWLKNVWKYCQSGGMGHAFRIYQFDHDMKASARVNLAIKSVLLLHTWPAHWNVKPEHYPAFILTCDGEIKAAFAALGYKIFVSTKVEDHAWFD